MSKSRLHPEARRVFDIQELETRLAPAIIDWIGDVSGNSNWNANVGGNTNWAGNVLPTAADTLRFSTATTTGNFTSSNNFTAGTAFAGLIIDRSAASSSNFNLQGNSINLGSAGIVGSVAGGTSTVQFPIVLTAPQTFSNTTSGGAIAITNTVNLNGNLLTCDVQAGAINFPASSVLTGAGGITKTGGGNLFVDGANDYTGITTVNGGSILTGSNTGLGATGNANRTVVNAAQLFLGNGGDSFAETLNAGAGAVIRSNGGNNTVTGSVVLLGDATIRNSVGGTTFTLTGGIGTGGFDLTFDTSSATSTIVYTSSLSGSGSVTKIGTGNLTFSGGFSNAHTGGTTINNGTVTANRNPGQSPFPAGNLVIGDGTNNVTVTMLQDDQFNVNANVSINNGGLLVAATDTVASLTVNAGGDINVNAGETFAVSGATTIVGTGSSDSLSFSGTQAAATINLGSTVIGPVNAQGGIVLNGGGGTDTFTAPDATNTWQITGANAATLNTFLTTQSVESLVGNSGADNFTFATGGSLSSLLNGGGGVDSITGDNTGRVYGISGANAGSITGIAAAGFLGIETLNGGTGADTFAFSSGGSLAGSINGGAGADELAADDGGRFFNISGVNTGSVTVIVAGGFTNVENLSGGAGADTFKFSSGGTLSGAANGKAGSDEIQGDNVLRLYNVSGTNTGSIGGIVPGGFQAVENLGGGSATDIFVFAAGGTLSGAVNGNGGADEIQGDNAGRVYFVSGTNTGSINGFLAGGFQSIENLLGGTGADTFQFTGGVMTGQIDGGTGSDEVRGDDTGRIFFISGTNQGSITNILAGGFSRVENLSGGSAADTFQFAGGSLTGAVNGNGGSDEIRGDDVSRLYFVSALNTGSITGILAAGFGNVENLTGGTASDIFTFGNNAQLSGRVDAGNPNAGAFAGTYANQESVTTGQITGDTLDLSAYVDAVFAILAQNGAAVRKLNNAAFNIASFFNGIENVFGGAGGDSLVGDDRNNVLMGNGGNDTISGAGGNDLLLGVAGIDNLDGGQGTDSLNGGAGADLLVDNDGNNTDLLVDP